MSSLHRPPNSEKRNTNTTATCERVTKHAGRTLMWPLCDSFPLLWRRTASRDLCPCRHNIVPGSATQTQHSTSSRAVSLGHRNVRRILYLSCELSLFRFVSFRFWSALLGCYPRGLIRHSACDHPKFAHSYHHAFFHTGHWMRTNIRIYYSHQSSGGLITLRDLQMMAWDSSIFNYVA